MINKLKKVLKSKKAIGSVATAIKVSTACVLGAAILVGGVALANDVVLPNTSDKVANIAAYEGGEAGGGSIGGVEPVSVPAITTFEFSIGTGLYTAEEGMTWAEWCDSEWNTDGFYIKNGSVHKSSKLVVMDEYDDYTSSYGTITEYDYILFDVATG